MILTHNYYVKHPVKLESGWKFLFIRLFCPSKYGWKLLWFSYKLGRTVLSNLRYKYQYLTVIVSMVKNQSLECHTQENLAYVLAYGMTPNVPVLDHQNCSWIVVLTDISISNLIKYRLSNTGIFISGLVQNYWALKIIAWPKKLLRGSENTVEV